MEFILVLTFFIIFFCTAFVVPTLRVYKLNKVNPITFQSSDSAHDLIGKYMKLLMILVFISALSYEFFKFTEFFNNSEAYICGWFLMISSLIFMSVAQMQMKDSWRIGIDEKQVTVLRTDGIFGFTRNPIFAATIVALTGNFLVYSTVLNLILLIFGIVLVSIQIRLEEEHLYKIHKEKYLDYKNKVKRRLFI